MRKKGSVLLCLIIVGCNSESQTDDYSPQISAEEVKEVYLTPYVNSALWSLEDATVSGMPFDDTGAQIYSVLPYETTFDALEIDLSFRTRYRVRVEYTLTDGRCVSANYWRGLTYSEPMEDCWKGPFNLSEEDFMLMYGSEILAAGKNVTANILRQESFVAEWLIRER